jgi:hypothetical protein
MLEDFLQDRLTSWLVSFPGTFTLLPHRGPVSKRWTRVLTHYHCVGNGQVKRAHALASPSRTIVCPSKMRYLWSPMDSWIALTTSPNLSLLGRLNTVFGFSHAKSRHFWGSSFSGPANCADSDVNRRDKVKPVTRTSTNVSQPYSVLT